MCYDNGTLSGRILNIDKKVTGIVAYLTWVGLVLAFVMGDRKGAKFHLNQALVLNLCSLVVGILGGIVSILGILNVVILVLWIIGFVGAIQGKEKAVPLLGGIVLLK